MHHYRFKDLEITSAKLPFNTHLFWYHSTYGLILVDSLDQTKLFISTDKGDNWGEIDLSDNTNSYKIQSGWLDGNDLWLVMCDNDGTADDFEVCYIELDDSNDCNPIGVSAGADVNTVYVFDIFKIGTDIFVYNREARGGGASYLHVVWDVDTAPFVEKDTISIGWQVGWDYFYGLVIGSKFHIFTGISNSEFYDYVYDNTIPSISSNAGAQVGYDVPADDNLRGLSYDGDDIIYLIGEKDADGKYYLMAYSIIGDTLTALGEYNISLMLDRNCAGTNPTPQEKAFGLTGTSTNLLIFEIIPRGDYPMQIQDLSTISSTAGRHIIAINDYYLMLDTGLMFEYTNVNYMNDCRIHDGIFPYKKKFTFTTHPNHYIYWNIADMIMIYDNTPTLRFAGWIKTKPQKVGDKFECIGMGDEVFERTYDKSFTTDNTKEKLQDMTTNALEFCYEGTYDATATDWSYEYNRACAYLLNLTRWMEKQVPYIKPDGEIMVIDSGDLTASGESWTLGDGNQIAYLVDIPGINEKIPGYYKGNTGITSVSVRYMNNEPIVRPETPTESFRKKRLKELRDPKIQELATAQQIGDNLYTIFSLETIFLGLRGEGLGWLQPGETVEIENTKQITITQAHFLLQRVIYDPKNDVHHQMIFSNNIITPQEFKTEFDTSRQQIHTAVLQSSENQANLQYNCRIANGTYTGNDADNREITGLGFTPKAITITLHWDATTKIVFWKDNNLGTWETIRLDDSSLQDDSLKYISDGFEVDNSHASNYHNRTGKVYTWIALG